MKIDKYMLILSIVLISLLAISAVSASEDANATDIVETSDVDDVQAIDETLFLATLKDGVSVVVIDQMGNVVNK
jgi:hypothetical protein